MAIVGDGDDLVTTGDYVLFRFDRTSRETDKTQSNYRLPLHLGKITQVLDERTVEVWWMFGDAWDRHWIPWRFPRTNQAYKELMASSQVLQDTHGVAAKLSFVTRRKKLILDKQSQARIQEILGVDEYSASGTAAE
jgi:hypothetical protein